MNLSIIIPARDEAPLIARQIEYLRGLRHSSSTRVEIIVGDGGSSDRTVAIARQCGVLVVECSPNRGLQQNRAAQISSGEVLWFLHADARPHRRSVEYLQQAARRRKTCGGNFRLRFEGSTPATRVFARIARLQRRRGIYYGDSGIWIRREVFDALGGFQDWPLFEDYDLARRLENFSRRCGRRTEYSNLPIIVSSRRIEKNGGRVLAQWLVLQLLFSLGAPPEKLVRWYHSSR